MLVFVGLSIALDVEPILGAFLAGSVFAIVFRSRGVLEQQLNGFSYGFLIPIFFINVGLRFEIGFLADPAVAARALALSSPPPSSSRSFRVEYSPCAGSGYARPSPPASCCPARLSLIIAVATVGLELGLLTEEDRALAILLAAVTATLAPTMFRALAPPLPPETEA